MMPLINVSLTENCVMDVAAGSCDIPNILIENSKSRGNKNITSLSASRIASSKEEKPRHNKESFAHASSSVSSDRGSSGSVYQPKIDDKESCKLFIDIEIQYSETESRTLNECVQMEKLNTSNLIEKSPFKPTCCFIDAATLVDESSDVLENKTNEFAKLVNKDNLAQSLPPMTNKLDSNIHDRSESIDDSLDISPITFDVMPITEDPLCSYNNDKAVEVETSTNSNDMSNTICETLKKSNKALVLLSTPNNSIQSLQEQTFKNIKCYSESHPLMDKRDTFSNSKLNTKYNDLSVLSGGVSIADHWPHVSSESESTSIPKQVETPVVSGGQMMSKQKWKDNSINSKPSNSAAWVVDMSAPINLKNENHYVAITNGLQKEEINWHECNKKSNIEDNRHGINSIDSNTSGKCSQKFFVDLSTSPTMTLPEENISCEKKNIFSLFIDIGNNNIVKEIPPLVCSSQLRSSTSNSSPKMKGLESVSDESNVSEITHFNEPNIHDSEILNITKQKYTKSTLDVLEKINESYVHTENIVKQHSFSKDSASHNLLEKLSKDHDSDTNRHMKNKKENDSFVKLSDLDKTLKKSDVMLLREDKVVDVRLTRSIPEKDWCDHNHSGSLQLTKVTRHSFHSENALSLNRLFPHLRNEFRRSMPGSLTIQNASLPGTEIASSSTESVISEARIMQSSSTRFVLENNTSEYSSELSSLIENCQSRLGQDLLRIFLEEIGPDVIVEVSGRRFKAHKLILTSRCQYFAAILSGGWVECTGNVIHLPSFSLDVVYFTLCHIYSGISTIPDSLNIMELANIADMLCLEGLKEAVIIKMKAKYCHHFHEPCHVCIAGVLKCLPLTTLYGLDVLYHECVRWITKYFTVVWPTKSFATLPKDLLERFYKQITINLTIENFLDTINGCEITVNSLQKSRWAQSVASMCHRLVNYAARFAASKLVMIFKQMASVPAHESEVSKRTLLECITAAIELASSVELCNAYTYLTDIVEEISVSKTTPILNTNSQEKNQYVSLLHTEVTVFLEQCQKVLVNKARSTSSTEVFRNLCPHLKKQLREQIFNSYGSQASANVMPMRGGKTRSATQLQNGNIHSVNQNLLIDCVKKSFVPYVHKQVKSKETSTKGVQDKERLNLTKLQVRTTKAQEKRTNCNLKKIHQSQERLDKSNQRPYSNVKPRYMESKPRQEPRTSRLRPLLTGATNKDSSSEASFKSSTLRLKEAKTNGINCRERNLTGRSTSQDSVPTATISRPHTAEPSVDSLKESQIINLDVNFSNFNSSKSESLEPIKSRLNDRSSKYLKSKIPVPKTQISKLNSEHAKVNDNTEKMTLFINRPVARTKDNRELPASSRSINKAGPSKCALKGNKDVKLNIKSTMKSKIVPKELKNAPETQNHFIISSSFNKDEIKSSKHNSGSYEPENNLLPATMQRSGTFSKDEPMFRDKITNIDSA